MTLALLFVLVVSLLITAGFAGAGWLHASETAVDGYRGRHRCVLIGESLCGPISG